MRRLFEGTARAMLLAGISALVVLGSSEAQAPSAESKGERAHRDILATEKKLYSLRNEELIIRDFFQDRRDGVFLDVGCAWPIKENNTYYLEAHLGWSGIAVDALAEYAKPWWKRKNSRFFTYLVGDHSGTVDTFYRAEKTDISSIQPMKDHADVKYEATKVPSITLTKLLDDNGVPKIDFLSMDIENSEAMALAGFDIERFRPSLACVEAKGANRAAILKYFGAHGYGRIMRYARYDQVNYYFTPKPKTARALK